jgi:thymidylate kinase
MNRSHSKMIYYLTGADGCGKTTLINLVSDKLLLSGKYPVYIWLRSPKIISKLLMVYCRLIGLTKYERINGIRYGKHEFYRSKFVSWLFPILQLLDFKLTYLGIKRKIELNSVILFDRFSLDTLADLMVDTNRYNLHKTWIGKSFLNLLPKETKIIFLKVDELIIRNRKIDTLYDPHLSKKIEAYSILAKDLNIEFVENIDSKELVIKKIFAKLGL